MAIFPPGGTTPPLKHGDSPSKHLVTYQGKGFEDDPADFSKTTPMSYYLADDDPKCGERSGWGMPVSVALKKKMVLAYKSEMDDLYKKVQLLPNNIGEIDLTGLKTTIAPDKEVVGGVYGKETLLTLLAQPGCEGILYINCIYGGKRSIVLQGIDKDGQPIAAGITDQGGRKIQGREYVERRLKDVENNPEPINGDELVFEVKGGSITRQELEAMGFRDDGESYINAFFNPL